MYELALVWSGLLIGFVAGWAMHGAKGVPGQTPSVPSDPESEDLEGWTRELDQRLGLREQANVAAAELARSEQAIAEKRGMVPSVRPKP